MPEPRTNHASLRLVFLAWGIALVAAAGIAIAVGWLQLWRIDRQLSLAEADQQLDALYERIVPLWDRPKSLVELRLLNGKSIPGEPYEVGSAEDVFVEADERSLFRFFGPATRPGVSTVLRTRVEGADIAPQFAGWVIHLKFVNDRLHGASAYNPARAALRRPVSAGPRVQRWAEGTGVIAAFVAVLCLFIAWPLGPRWRRQVSAIGLAAAMLVVVVACLHPSPGSRTEAYAQAAMIPWALVVAALAASALVPDFRRPISASPRCRCGYDLTGNESGVCPECGRPTARGRIDRWADQADAIASVSSARRFDGPCLFTSGAIEAKLDELAAALMSAIEPRSFAGALIGTSLACYRFDLSDGRRPMSDREPGSDLADEASDASQIYDDTPDTALDEAAVRAEVDRRTRESRLNEVHVKQVMTERKALFRMRSYFVALAVTAAVAAVQLGIWINSRLHRSGFDLFVIGYAVAIVGMVIAVVFSIRRIRRYTAELAVPVQTDPVDAPDFSTLSDGSQRLDSAAEHLQRLYERGQG